MVEVMFFFVLSCCCILLLLLVGLTAITTTVLLDVQKVLNKILLLLMPKEASGVEFYVEINGQYRKVTNMQMKANDKLSAKVSIKDKFGNEANVDGKLNWSLSEESLGSLSVSEDALSAEFIPAGPIGSLSVKVSGDADLGEGVKSIEGQLEIEILAGEAESLLLLTHAAEISAQ